MLRQIPPVVARLFALCSCLALAAVCALAQSQASTGNIEGRVLDPNGAVVTGAVVTAKNQETGLERTATTDEEGSYRIVLLPPGSYSVEVASSGFENKPVRDVPVTIGGRTPLDIGLSVAGTGGTITVTGEAPAVETTRTSVSTTINERAIDNLPVNGRNFLDFATLSPAVVRDPTRAGDLSVGGQKGTLNSVLVDGADNNNTFFGQSFGRTGVRPPYQFSEESVQEFQVNQNGFSAEFGRAGGAVIIVATKSGTNAFHGGLFEYLRDESLNSNTPILTARGAKRPKSQINQFGGYLGGPIKKDRAFFFFTYDGQRSDLPVVVDPPNFATAPAGARALLLPLVGTYQSGRDQDVYLLRGDVQLTRDNQLSLRFNQQNFTGVNNENAGVLSVEEHSGNSVARTTTFSGTLASTLTSSLVNEFRFQFGRDREPGEANSDDVEARIQTGGGFLQIGRNNFSPRETTIKRAQFVDNLSYVTGRHNLKGGVDVVFDRILNFFPGLFSGQYTFNSYADFAANRPATYTQSFAGPGTTGPTTEPDLKDYAFFLQDDWRATPRLTFNLGVRYDYQSLAAPPIQNPDPALLAAGFDTSRRPSDKDNFAPRLGFSYAFDDRTVLRGGYGIFYGRTPAIMVGTAHSQNGIQVTNVNLTCTTTPANPCPTYPATFAAVPTGATPVRPNLYLFADEYKQPYVQQGRLGFERELFKDFAFSATYLFYRGVHLSRTRDANLFAPVSVQATAPDGQTFQIPRFPSATPAGTAPLRPLAAYNRISLFESSGNSLYHGLALEARQRFSKSFQFIAAYTFSKSEDDKPDQVAVVFGTDDVRLANNPLDLRSDYGTSDADIPHRFVFSPVYDLGSITWSDNPLARGLFGHWNLSGILQLQSGFAYSALVAADLNRDTNSSVDRAPGTRRNEFRTPNVYQLDARVTKLIPLREGMRIRLIAEAFNLFNRANLATENAALYRGFTVNPTTGNVILLPALPATPFGGPRTFLTERQIQLAVKFDF